MRTVMASMKTLLFVFLHWVLEYAVCRNVILPAGNLYRVAGFSLSLPCAVSGYEGPRTQEFEWFLYRDDAVGRQMGVVSTRDKDFPYAPFQPRVRNGEVRVERDSGDKVRLVIQRLRADDQGKYECYTPSTDSTYQGNYSALVTVKVIPDTLQISYSRSLTGQPVPEGAEITLTCSASIDSEQLTHLSIMFGKRGSGEVSGSGAGGEVSTVREIISIDKLLGVVPGRSYKARYDDGEITLEKRNGEGGQGVYVMKMRAVQPDDTGSYFCEASQWIMDPDRSWQKIAQRTLDIGNLTVQQLAESLSVTASPKDRVTLQVGSPLILTCEVLGLPSEVNSGLLVQWMKRGSVSSSVVGTGGVEVEVARMSPDGVVSWGDDLSKANAGSMEKVAAGKYNLKLFSAQPSDSGVYRCVASVYAGRRNPGPSTPATLTQRSDGVAVNLKTKDVLISAVAHLPRGPLLKRGSTITLICNTTVTTTGPAQVQVQWLRWPLPPLVEKRGQNPDPPVVEKPTLVAALMYDGVANIYVTGSEVSIDRLSAISYRLRVHAATMDDQGIYACHAVAWGQNPNGDWYNTWVKAESNTVTVYLYARAADLLLIPLVVGVSSALFVGIAVVGAVTCCFMKRLARQRTRK
ncbi:immunoglobulin superfamily member 8 [Mastacembelus armatus]|uniref:Immunoglobulin superfamily, member 8 n=1 Tax=Mastacembelus armatus TaxID=205130 RepID=A0A3Q3LXT9_9TELE|nr:immunoglobulin superfamily member 8 [Mastacembelus armatus]XP_026163457.1 immunoglobulin superfamily member 8 [Mastacembelus armatus]XP_026163458.1 immunoglobulin superfamily member 8 [Mastacembelus armatus]XP_026163459.1 immunoglobulin superfamily member 8 [Mastacembelus armatus]